EDQLRVPHGGKHAGADRFQDGGIAATGIQYVPAVAVDHARMHVQAGARMFGVGLGHAGGFQPVPSRRLLDDALEIDAVVGGGQRVGAVQEVDLELAG